jgi:Protein of unknown function (DUF3253)
MNPEAQKPHRMTAADAILHLLAEKGPGKSIGPMDVAKLVAGADWSRRLPDVRQSAVHLARQGRIAILRHNKPVDPNDFRGVWRMSLPVAHVEAAVQAE